jgi:hypothetical protein
MERFFEGRVAMPPGQVDPETYRRVAHAAWMQVVGPPMASGEGDFGLRTGVRSAHYRNTGSAVIFA